MKFNKARTEEIEELNEIRLPIGLSTMGAQVKERTCLQCSKTFMSTGFTNRICRSKTCSQKPEETMDWFYSAVAPAEDTLRVRKLRRQK